MGEIADMMLEGLLDEETGEYVGDLNEAYFGDRAPGFPVSYDKDRPYVAGMPLDHPSEDKVRCPYCDKSLKLIGLQDHIVAKHVEDRNAKVQCPLCQRQVKLRGLSQHMHVKHAENG